MTMADTGGSKKITKPVLNSIIYPDGLNLAKRYYADIMEGFQQALAHSNKKEFNHWNCRQTITRQRYLAESMRHV